MAYTQSRMLLARVTSLELKASDVHITLCNLLASSKKHGHSLTQSEERDTAVRVHGHSGAQGHFLHP